MLEKIYNAESIWIYGIGVIGKRICQIFEFYNIKINGIIVSDKTQNLPSYRGIEVFNLEEVRDKHALIIVSANGKARQEIETHLKKNGYSNYIVWTDDILREIWKKSDYIFEDRQQGREKICLVLSGYKDFLWPIVYKRLKMFVPDDTEVCICSAGIYSKELSHVAKEYGWSYLSTSINSVSLIQNIAISIYDNARWIYKMDEDIFVTQNMFENIFGTYEKCESELPYKMGFVAPLILVNGFCYRHILDMYGRLDDFERKFGKAYVGGDSNFEIVKNPDAAKYMWGEGGLPHLDTIAKELENNTDYLLANVRFSIGMILLKRDTWNAMQGYEVLGNRDLGVDEEDIGRYCMNESCAIVVAQNALAGHFSFGKQTSAMKEYFLKNTERFAMERKSHPSIALCGYRKQGREMYKKLLEAGVTVPYIIERNYQSLSHWESDLGIRIVGFQESKEFYKKAEAILLTGDLPETIVEEAMELAEIDVPIITKLEV